MERAGPRLSDEGHKVYRVRQTCMKMLEKRGYNVLQEHVSMSSEAFLKEFGADPQRHNLTLLVEKVHAVIFIKGHANIRILRSIRNFEVQNFGD